MLRERLKKRQKRQQQQQQQQKFCEHTLNVFKPLCSVWKALQPPVTKPSHQVAKKAWWAPPRIKVPVAAFLHHWAHRWITTILLHLHFYTQVFCTYPTIMLYCNDWFQCLFKKCHLLREANPDSPLFYLKLIFQSSWVALWLRIQCCHGCGVGSIPPVLRAQPKGEKNGFSYPPEWLAFSDQRYPCPREFLTEEFFWPYPRRVEVPGAGIEPEQWSQWILLWHKGTSHRSIFKIEFVSPTKT